MTSAVTPGNPPTTLLPATAAPAQVAAMLPAQVPQQDCELTFSTRLGLEALQRAGKLFSTSPLVPKEYQGTDGLASCAIALDLANRIGANPLMVMQNLYIVHGRPGWSSKFKIAIFNQCGKFSPIRYRFTGEENTDDWGCRACAIDLRTGEELVGPKVTIALAKAEGWYTKQGSKWKTMPEQMLRYRSAGWFVDTVAPELGMGLPTAEDLEDIEGEVIREAPVTALPALAATSAPALPPPPPAPPAPPTSASGRLSRLRQPKDVTPPEETLAAAPQPTAVDPAVEAEENAYQASLEEYARVLRDKGRPEPFITSAINSWRSQTAADRVARLHQAIKEAQAAPAAPAARIPNPDDKAPAPLVPADDPTADLPWPEEGH